MIDIRDIIKNSFVIYEEFISNKISQRKELYRNRVISVLKVVHHRDARWTNTMILFQFIRRIYQTMGILSPSSNNQKYPINSKILIILLPTTFFCISSVIFLLLESKSIQEYGDSLYWSTSAIEAVFLFFRTVWKMPVTLKFIEQFEEIIQKS